MTDAELGAAIRRIWEDQRAFNTLFRPAPTDEKMMTKQVRDFVLYTDSELHELLRVLKWKEHRTGIELDVNHGQMNDELADILKCTMSLYQICGIADPSDLITHYDRKTAVVRQRYQEEWGKKIAGPCAIVDIDMVLCDYVVGMVDWLSKFGNGNVAWKERLEQIRASGQWINGEAIGMPEVEWQRWKHQFRISGAKRDLPVFDDARSFLSGLWTRGIQIVLLTSRPIDKYPNIYTDTLLWLQRNHLRFDCIWWSFDKAEQMLQRDIQAHVQFVVDDDVRHLDGFARLGLPCYLLRRRDDRRATAGYHLVHTLDELLAHYDAKEADRA